MDAAWREVRASFSAMELPWESNPMLRVVMGGAGVMADAHLDAISVAGIPPPDVSAPPPPTVTSASSAGIPVKAPKASSSKRAPAEQDTETRRELLEEWRRFALQLGPATPARLLDAHGSPVDMEEFLSDRKSGTLATRASAMRQFVAWFKDSGRSFEAFSEEDAYLYVTHLAETGAAATRASAFRKLMNFITHTFGLHAGPSIAMSARVRNVALKSTRRKQQTAKRDCVRMMGLHRLETEVVLAERGSEDAVLSPSEAVVAGFLCFAVHSRSRAADLVRVQQEPVLDLAPDGNSGYIEAETLGERTKTGGTTKRAKLLVPIVGHALGLAGVPWAESWLSLRARLGLCATVDGCLQTELLRGGTFGKAAADSRHLTDWLRFIMLKLDPPSAALNLGRHSCKATLLALAAKIGLGRDDRRILGGHSDPQDVSVLEYSRDALAGPLRRLEKALLMVRKGLFDPDATRSGRWKDTAEAQPFEVDIGLPLRDAVTPPRSPRSASPLPLADREDEQPGEYDEDLNPFGLDALGEFYTQAPLPREPELPFCGACSEVINPEEDTATTCVCGLEVHNSAPCLVPCEICGQSLCPSCRDPAEHDCIYLDEGLASASSAESTTDESSSNGSEAIEELVAARAAVPAGEQEGGERAHEQGTPEVEASTKASRVVVSIRWHTAHRPNDRDEGHTACGLTISDASHFEVAGPEAGSFVLCRREGCFGLQRGLSRRHSA